MSENLTKKQITELLPHREPMLLIDELTNIKKLFSASAIVNVRKNSFFVQGHFPGKPVMPGVLIVEAFGQAAAALTAYGIDPKEYENKFGKLDNNNELVNENEVLSKLIEISVTKDKPIIVTNKNNEKIGFISQSDLLKAVVEGNENE